MDPAADDAAGGGAALKTQEGSSPSSSSPPAAAAEEVLENVLEEVLRYLPARRDRGAVSLVCKSWWRAESLTRADVFVGNCYAVSPARVVRRFPRARSVVLKGRPRFADFNLVPPDWGAHFGPWVEAMAAAYPLLEKVCLKRMTVTDRDLGVLAESFLGFKEMVLVCCDGFGTKGLAELARKCRHLRVLDLIEDEVMEDGEDWISCFPETMNCLESLSFDCVESPINFDALENLVARCPSLKKLSLNRHVSVRQLQRLMIRAPQLMHLGTGSFSSSDDGQGEEQLTDLSSAFSFCKFLVSLSGFREIIADFLPAVFPVCTNLTSLNLSYATITSEQLRPVIIQCHKLQVFWALDSIRDEGLLAVASTCKDLLDLRVFPVDPQEDSDGQVSDVGLIAISEGCRKLRSILYFCQDMTNAAVITMSKNCPDLVVFRLCIMGRHRPDHLTGQSMDEGFGAIVMNCKKLTRLAISGLLTDKAFDYIGKYGKLVRTLSVAFAGDGDMGLRYVLEGCHNLQKLEIRDSPFGDDGLLSGLHHYYNMRFLWMSSCRLSLRSCKKVAESLSRMVVEVITDINEEVEDDLDPVEKLYMYRSLEEPRHDAPVFVKIL